MNKVFAALSKPAKWIYMFGSFAYALLYVIAYLISAGNNGTMNSFFPAISVILIVLLAIILIPAAGVLILLKQEKIAKIVFMVLGDFAVLSYVFNGLNEVQNWADPQIVQNAELWNTCIVFNFFFALSLLAVIVLIIISVILKKKLLQTIAFFAFLGVMLLAFLTGVFYTINGGVVDVGFAIMTQIILEFFIQPVLLVFGYLYFFGAPELELGFVKTK